MKFLAEIKLKLKFLWDIASNSLQKTYIQHLLKFRFKEIKKCRSGNLSGGKMSGWGFVAVRNCPGGKMSGWEIVTWDVVRWEIVEWEIVGAPFKRQNLRVLSPCNISSP